MVCRYFSGDRRGAFLHGSADFTETVYQYIAGGAAEAVLLMVIIRMSDEPYKIKAIKMYMVDYLENVCAVRCQKTEQERKRIY